MKLSEWSEKLLMGGGAEQWARLRVARAIREVEGDKADPVVFAVTSPVTREQPQLSIQLWAAGTLGLATVTITTDPIREVDTTLTIEVQAWAAGASAMRLDSKGDAENDQPLTVIAGGHQVSSTRFNRDELLDFFRECVRLAR